MYQTVKFTHPLCVFVRIYDGPKRQMVCRRTTHSRFVFYVSAFWFWFDIELPASMRCVQTFIVAFASRPEAGKNSTKKQERVISLRRSCRVLHRVCTKRGVVFSARSAVSLRLFITFVRRDMDVQTCIHKLSNSTHGITSGWEYVILFDFFCVYMFHLV